MDRRKCHKMFNMAGPVVLPVIHVLDEHQITRNIDVACGEGAPGVFLINHDFPYAEFLPLIEQARKQHDDVWLGVNFLGVTGREAFPVLGDLADRGIRVDAYWADDARIDETEPADIQSEAAEIDRVRATCHWPGLYFGGTAFKKQRPVDPDRYAEAATLACNHMDVVTTSGVATGKAVDHEKIRRFRTGCGDTALAVASGITPENAASYGADVDCFLVATGINIEDDFYNIAPAKLNRLMKVSRELADADDGL